MFIYYLNVSVHVQMKEDEYSCLDESYMEDKFKKIKISFDHTDTMSDFSDK